MKSSGAPVRADVGFRWEADLVGQFERILPQISFGPSSTGDFEDFREVPAEFGVPDLVRVAWHDGLLESRNRSGLSFLQDRTELVSLRSLPQDGLTVRAWSERAQVSPDVLRRRIGPSLVDGGWIEMSARGYAMPLSTYAPLARAVVAFEAKLKDWKRALKQALRYKSSADKAFVVLDATRARPALEHISAFRTLGVGLITVDLALGRTTVHARPRTRAAGLGAAVVAERAAALRNAGLRAGQSWPVFGRDLVA